MLGVFSILWKVSSRVLDDCLVLKVRIAVLVSRCILWVINHCVVPPLLSAFYSALDALQGDQEELK